MKRNQNDSSGDGCERKELSGASDIDDVFNDSSLDGYEGKKPKGSAAQTVDWMEAYVIEEDLGKENLTELPCMSMSSSPSGSPPDPSSPPALKFNGNDDRDLAHGGSSVMKRLEHAPPGELLPPPGFRLVESLEMHPVVPPRNRDVTPGAFPTQPTRNTATSGTPRAQITSYESTEEVTDEEYEQEEEEEETHDSSRMATEIGLYNAEAQVVPPDGNGEGTMKVAEAKSVTMKWYQRQTYRRIFVGLALFVCGLIGVVTALVIRPSSASSSSLLSPPTPGPIAGPPGSPTAPPFSQELVACTFLSIPNVTKCRSTFKFESYSTGDRTTGSKIPTEIGLLTQLTYLDFYDTALTSTIPSEIGLLTKLSQLYFINNQLTSTVPTEIGLLQQLTELQFENSRLASRIPSEIGLLQRLRSSSFFRNSFNSAIPSELGLLQQLTFLDFSYNALTSTIPSEFGLMMQLTSLEFQGNDLEGIIPSSLCLLPSISLFVDCGKIACDCCSCP